MTDTGNTRMPFEKPIKATPEEYELATKQILDAAGLGLVSYESEHLLKVHGTDGDYVIDIVARFEALGAHFLVLVECKHQGRDVERSDVQILHSKLRSVGAQKALLFSISGFQQGAIDFAATHGIALIQFSDGATCWFTKSVGPPTPPPASADIPKYIGWWHHNRHVMLLSATDGRYTREAVLNDLRL